MRDTWSVILAIILVIVAIGTLFHLVDVLGKQTEIGFDYAVSTENNSGSATFTHSFYGNDWQGYLPGGSTLTVVPGNEGAEVCIYQLPDRILQEKKDDSGALFEERDPFLSYGPFNFDVYVVVKESAQLCNPLFVETGK